MDELAALRHTGDGPTPAPRDVGVPFAQAAAAGLEQIVYLTHEAVPDVPGALAADGNAVGKAVGRVVGHAGGRAVGTGVGRAVGRAVGTGVGAAAPPRVRHECATFREAWAAEAAPDPASAS